MRYLGPDGVLYDRLYAPIVSNSSTSTSIPDCSDREYAAPQVFRAVPLPAQFASYDEYASAMDSFFAFAKSVFADTVLPQPVLVPRHVASIDTTTVTSTITSTEMGSTIEMQRVVLHAEPDPAAYESLAEYQTAVHAWSRIAQSFLQTRLP
eukprot:ANDGO_01488.mRNA.1 hypothetical protein